MEQVTRNASVSGWQKGLLVLATLASLAGIGWLRASFAAPQLYQKDFLQGYLMAQALRAGVNPYLPVPELAQRWLPEHNYTKLNHPSPHTLAIAWLCWPLATLPYETAVRVWLVLELLFLAVGLALLARLFAIRWTWLRFGLGMLLACGWAPVMQDLWLGQFSLLLLLLLLGAWLALRQGRDWQAGLWLGCMLTLKLAGWPLVLYLLVRRRWQAVAATGATTALAHLLLIGCHGWELVRDYYVKVGPLVSAVYRGHDANPSLWTFGQRLFAEFGNNFLTQSPFAAPGLARVVGAAFPLLVLAVSLYGASRLRDFEAGLAWLAALSAVLNPVAWTHYWLLAVPALGWVLRRLQALGWPQRWLRIWFAVSAPLCVTHVFWSLLALVVSGAALAAERPTLPFWAGWLTVVPTLALLGLCGLLWRVERFIEAQQPVAKTNVNWWPEWLKSERAAQVS